MMRRITALSGRRCGGSVVDQARRRRGGDRGDGGGRRNGPFEKRKGSLPVRRRREEGSISSMDDEELQRIYTWVDEVPLSRPKRNIARDFADGVLTAEMVAHYFPKLVEMHNYPAANSYAQKIYNW
eukprot:6199833-Pleurochrysis_carterae.AAC.2